MTLNKLFTLPDTELKSALWFDLQSRGYNPDNMYHTNDFLYAEGDAPYMLVAHLDTVHKELPSVICYSRDGNYIMSPQGIGGDDRCGVYIILSLLNRLSFKPYILFTMGEEKGCIGAKAFIKFMSDDPYSIPDLKFIVEYDRKGDKDCVFYRCGNKDFEKFVEGFGFKTALGSCSDICHIAPEFGCAAVNLSSGYYNPHTQHEYVCMADMHNTIDASFKMLTAECGTFKWIEKPMPTYQNTHKRTSNIYRQVRVTMLPPNVVKVKSTYSSVMYNNISNEVAIDANGNYYKYIYTYRDWEPTDCVEPIGDFVPKYNAKESRMISVYSYSIQQNNQK